MSLLIPIQRNYLWHHRQLGTNAGCRAKNAYHPIRKIYFVESYDYGWRTQQRPQMSTEVIRPTSRKDTICRKEHYWSNQIKYTSWIYCYRPCTELRLAKMRFNFEVLIFLYILTNLLSFSVCSFVSLMKWSYFISLSEGSATSLHFWR